MNENLVRGSSRHWEGSRGDQGVEGGGEHLGLPRESRLKQGTHPYAETRSKKE